jgi:ATP-binding cassette subfamily C protein LapB
MGTLIACSILAGRITQPVMSIPNLMVQWGMAKASIADIDQFWKLKLDHEVGIQPLRLNNIRGEYEVSKLKMHYGTTEAISVESLQIAPGSRVGIVGPIGSGKTTLLRALSGMYKPAEGRVRLDGVEIDMIERSNLAQHLAYIPQDGRLFEGTIRENLLVGLEDPGDDRILEVARLTGLQELVLAPHTKGLEREISEGGLGLSGGQRQLVHLTRAFLKNPSVWLLDEPTASMDPRLEEHVIQCLREQIKTSQKSTFVFITHKPAIVQVCERLIFIANGKIVLDGPRDQVLAALTAGAVSEIRQ